MNARVLACLLFLATPAFAADPPDAAPTAAPPAAAEPAPVQQDAGKPNPDDKVCRREKTIGSNRPTTVCRTRAQAELERERAREEAARHSRN